MAVLTTSTVLPPAVAQWFDRRLLMRAVPLLVYMQAAYRRSLPRNNGTTVVFRRINGLSLALATLVEGVPGAGQALSKTDVASTALQWGDYVTMTDYGRAVVENDLLQAANDVLGEQSGQTMDALLRDVCVAGTNVFYGGGVANRAALVGVPQKIDQTIIDRVVRTLDNANAKRFKEMVNASTKIDTHPIRPAYIGVCNPDARFSIQALPNFVSIEKYATSDERLIGEFGAYNDVRFCLSSQAKIYRGGGGTAAGDVKQTGGLADVAAISIFGEQAVGVVPLEKGNVENIVKPLGSAGALDPLNQVSTSGWKHTGTRLILNDAFMARIECTVGELAP
jgi:N4-gp56 family major capsid protein